MKEFFYYKSFRRTIIQFLDMFNNIRIGKYNNNGEIVKNVKVPIKLGPKSKMWYWLHDRKEDKVTPIIFAQVVGIMHDVERVTGSHFKLKFNKDTTTKTVSEYLNPIPYNIDIQLNVLCQYMVELDQIMEQILPYFNPHCFMRIYIPELQANYDVKVILESCAPMVDSELPEPEYRMVIYTIDFLIKGFMFQPVDDSKLIEKIVNNIYTNKNNFDERDTTSLLTSAASGGIYERIISIGIGYDGDLLWKYEVFD